MIFYFTLPSGGKAFSPSPLLLRRIMSLFDWHGRKREMPQNCKMYNFGEGIKTWQA